MSARQNHLFSGFTLIELMIVVAIIAILASIAIPKFADMVRKAQEGATKGNLGSVRSALTIYYSDMEGMYPGDATGFLGTKYIATIPVAYSYYHVSSSNIWFYTGWFIPGTGNFSDPLSLSAGISEVYAPLGWSWGYNTSYPLPPGFGPMTDAGTFFVNCNHTDSKGTIWTMY